MVRGKRRNCYYPTSGPVSGGQGKGHLQLHACRRDGGMEEAGPRGIGGWADKIRPVYYISKIDL